MSDAGKATFAGNVVVTGDLTVSGDDLFMGTNTDAYMLIADGTNYNPVAISGDIAITNAGVTSIASNSIVNADVNSSAAIADSKLATISTADKVAGGAIQVDSGTDGTGIIVVDGDKFLIDDDGTTKYINASQLSAYIVAEGSMSSFQLEDDDGTEVTINNANEIKLIGSGITTNWTDTDNGTDADPYDMTFTVDAAQTGITSVYNASLAVGYGASHANIDFSTDNAIILDIDGTQQVKLVDGVLQPITDSDVDLGTTGVRWKDAFVDSITVTGEVDGNTLDIEAGGDIKGTLEVDNLTIAGAQGSDGEVLTSTGSGVGWEAAGGGGGIEVAEQWRLHTALASNAQSGILIENWEIDDTAGYGQIDAGMALSSGIFTFPDTGVWQIEVSASFGGTGGAGAVDIQTTQDDDAYATVSASGFSSAITNITYGVAHAVYLFDVTNTSNDKVKFTMGTFYSSGQMNGSTSTSYSTVVFIRLGDAS
jgi:cytoskeletal protein CcmA (bactofilin family)